METKQGELPHNHFQMCPRQTPPTPPQKSILETLRHWKMIYPGVLDDIQDDMTCLDDIHDGDQTERVIHHNHFQMCPRQTPPRGRPGADPSQSENPNIPNGPHLSRIAGTFSFHERITQG